MPWKSFEQERNKNKKKLEETRITLALISSFAITDCLQKVNFEGFNLVILTYELQSAFLYFVMWVIRKIGCFMWKKHLFSEN